MALDKLTRDELVAAAWHRADLTYLLHKTQREIKSAFHRSDGRVFVACCSRRLGKSYLALILSVEACLRKDRAQVRYAAPEKSQVRTIIAPLMGQILNDCPIEWKPSFHRQDGVYTFPNGSELHIAGCDSGGAERLRGVSTDLAVVDEAGFVGAADGADLEYVVQDIMLPQTITTDGRILLISTPSRTPEHSFVKFYCPRAQAEDRYIHRTIYDAPHISADKIEEFKRESGGETSTTWIREYLAQVVADEDYMVIPEFLSKESSLVGEAKRPEMFDAYVAADFGFSDFTAVLFAYYHFPSARIVIEDELAFQRTNSGKIAAAIKAKEAELWGNQKPLIRVGDASSQLCKDLTTDHGLSFRKPMKDDKEAAINQLRLSIQNEKLLIHPRCKHLLSHLRGAVWTRDRTRFARCGDFGHFDFVDAAIYLVRHVRPGKNPVPSNHGTNIDTHWIPKRQESESGRKLRAMVIPRWRR